MLDWARIDTVLLDMDGTLLDLHYDNHFWLEYVPQRYADTHGIAFEQARDELFARYKAVEGTLNWYCVDYWTEQLGMDIPLLKQEVQHLIAVHPDVVEFLTALRHAAKRAILVTNAHGKSLGLKMHRTQLGAHFERIVSSHDIGLPKEDARFWGKLRDHVSFDPATTLLVDDSLPVLRSAREFGIASLLAVHQPDTRKPPKDVADFPAIWNFREVMPVSASR